LILGVLSGSFLKDLCLTESKRKYEIYKVVSHLSDLFAIKPGRRFA